MNNHFFEKDNNKIKGVRQADIFREIIHSSQGYKPDYYIATTFGLNLGRVINQLYDVSFDILKNGRFDIYYDRFKASNSFSGKINDTDISGAFMGRIHSVKIDRNFHPKLQILRLKKSDKDIMYAVTVSSKNLTADDSVEVYAVLTGSPAEDNKEPNGKALKAFLEDFVKANECADTDTVEKILEEISRTKFTLYNSSEVAEVCFLPQTEVFSEIQKLSELVIVTPFISSTAVKEIGNNKIKMIVVRNELIDDKVENNTNGSSDKTPEENTADSNTPTEGTASETTKSGSSKYKHTDISKIWNESIKFYSMTNLHGKIYCGRTEDKKTALIIGSSNCTASGLGINSENDSECNRELNVMITFNDENSKFYNSFIKGLDSYCTKLTEKITASDSIKNDDDAKKKRGNLSSIIKEVTFDNGKYNVQFNMESLKKFNSVMINTTLIYDKNDEKKCKEEAGFSTEYISIYIDDVKINDIFLPDMVNNKDNDAFKNHTQAVKSTVIKELTTHFEQYIMCGRNSIQLRTNSDEQNPNGDKEKSNNTPASSLSYKDELYERLLKYATLIGDRKIFTERLKRLYNEAYSNSNNREAELLEMILGISKDKDEEKK